SVVSARALYHVELPEVDGGLGDELPALPAVEGPASGVADGPVFVPAPAPVPAWPALGVSLGSAVRLGTGDTGGPGALSSGAVGPEPGQAAIAAGLNGGAAPTEAAVGLPGTGPVARGTPVATTFGRAAAHDLRNGTGIGGLALIVGGIWLLRSHETDLLFRHLRESTERLERIEEDMTRLSSLFDGARVEVELPV